MNIAIMANAIGSLDKSLSEAKEALRAVESEVFGGAPEDMRIPVNP